MAALGTLGMEAAGTAASGLLGMVFGGMNDRRQINQQQKLTDMQLAANKKMSDYQYEQQNQTTQHSLVKNYQSHHKEKQ